MANTLIKSEWVVPSTSLRNDASLATLSSPLNVYVQSIDYASLKVYPQLHQYIGLQSGFLSSSDRVLGFNGASIIQSSSELTVQEKSSQTQPKLKPDDEAECSPHRES